MSIRNTMHLDPAQRSVREVMTPSPASVAPETPIADVVRALMSADFEGVPVVDQAGRALGMITQTDLLARGGVPLHQGLLSDHHTAVDSRLARLTSVIAEEMMTPDPVTVEAEARLDSAVEVMLHHNLKRLPVVDADGVVIGMLSRADVFSTLVPPEDEDLTDSRS